MTRDQTLVAVDSKYDSAQVRALNAWAKEHREGVVCTECLKLKRDLFPRRIDILLSELRKGTSYGVVAYFKIAAIHQTMLDFLGPRLPECCLGKCLWKDGSPIPDYHSIYFRDYILLRSGANSRNYNHKVCGTCGLITSCSDDTYVLKAELPTGKAFQDAACFLYLSESLARDFPWKNFRDLEPVEIPIRDEPLPDDPVPVRPYVERKVSPLSEEELANPAPLAYGPPEHEPRYPELRVLSPELPRMADDSAKSCPVSMREITDYLRLEGESVRVRDLTFVRTAEVDSHRCWLWRFAGSVRADCFVTVSCRPDGSVTIGYRLNSEYLTPEQYIYGERHGML